MSWFDDIIDTSQLYILLDVVIAAVLAGIVGFEREMKDKPAGLRTNMIVGSICALLVSVAYVLDEKYSRSFPKEMVSLNPTRIIQAIIVGVAFIGGGTVLKIPDKERVINLSTAAALLYSAGIGIAVGMKQYILAIGVAIMGLIINYVMLKVEKRLKKDGQGEHKNLD